MENVQSHFSRLAPKYRGLRITDLDPILSIKNRLRGFPSRIVAADIGCGDGRYDLELFHYLGERLFLYCVDSNRQMLNEVDGYLSRHGIRDFKIRQSEPPRDFRRLHFLRGWGHGKTKQILTRGQRTSSTDGVRA